MAYAFANWGRAPGQPMTDEQRRAMWAKSRGGGRRPQSTGTSPDTDLSSQYDRMRAAGIKNYDSDNAPSWWDKTKSFFGGAWDGAKGGTAILGSKLTFGATDALGRAVGIGDSSQFQGGDYDFSRGAGTVARESLLAALGVGVLSKLGAAWKGTSLAQSAAGQHARLLSAVGGLASKYGIDSFRERNPTIDPRLDKALAMASQLSGYVGAIGLLGAGHQYGRAALSGTKLAASGKSLIAGIDKGLSAPFKWIGGKMPAPVAGALKRAHGLYSSFSDFTGASIKDLISKPVTTSDWLKKAYVATGIAGVAARDEIAVRQYQKMRESALREGRDFIIPADRPRGLAGTIGAAAIGTTGNPIEKLFRPGLQAFQASVGAYRADYDAIKADQKAGRITAKQADDALAKLARNKPMNIQGKELWQFAPAAAAAINWKLGDAMSEARRSSVEKTVKAHDADTVMTKKHPQGIRMQDINAPEIENPFKPGVPAEYLGPEAASRIQQLIRPGQYVRVVTDSRAEDGGYDKYGRKLGVVETLPKPFDQLLRVPYIGKVIPARDVNKTLIKEGLVDIHYRQLSGRTDRQEANDAARAIAQAAGRGIWSAEGRAALPWVGTEKTVEERRQANFRRQTGQDLPYPQWSEVSDRAGIGLMTTGNSGVFGMMPRSGVGAAQAWNAALAVLGAVEFNERASRALDRRPRAPAVVVTDWQRRMESLGYPVPSGSSRSQRATAAELRALDHFLSQNAP